MSESSSINPSEPPRRGSEADSRTSDVGSLGAWQAIERRVNRGLLADAEAIAEIHRTLGESLATLEEPQSAVLHCLRVVDRLGQSSPEARHAANAFRRWSDRVVPRVDETLDYLEIDARRLVYKDQHDVHTTWLRSRSRSARLGLSVANRMSLLDLSLEFGIPTAVGDALRWRSGIRGGIAAPGLVEPDLTEWAVRALFVLLQRRGTRAAAFAELLTAIRDPLLAPIVARLATNTMLSGDAAREKVAEGVEALRQVLIESRDKWTAREADEAEAAADWMTARLAATSSPTVP